MGEAPGARGFFVGAGFNSVGIASAGGAGRALAEWIVEGEPTSDLVAVDIRRFAPFHGDTGRCATGSPRCSACTTPCRGRTARWRPPAPSAARPLHDRLAAAGASFGSKMGWERPNFFAPVGGRGALDYAWGKPSWLPWSAAEQRADPGGGRGLRPDVVLQVRRRRARRAGGAAVGLRRRRGRRGRPERLHAVAQRARRLRVRPDRHPDRRRGVPVLSQLGHDGPRPRLDPPPRAGVRGASRRDTAYAVLGVMGPRSRDLLRPPDRRRPGRGGVPVRDQPG